MNNFNLAVNKIIESNTVGGVMGQAAINGTPYADKDNRPIEPARIVIGAKFKKKKNKKDPDQQTILVPVQRRPLISDNLK